jgi:hypothetical protein
MNAYELIDLIRASGGKITCDNEQLIVEAARSVLTEEIEKYLRIGKPLLVVLLKIEELLLLFRQKHPVSKQSEVDMLLSEIIKDSSTLSDVLVWLEFLVDTGSELEMIEYNNQANIPNSLTKVSIIKTLKEKFERYITQHSHDNCLVKNKQ